MNPIDDRLEQMQEQQRLLTDMREVYFLDEILFSYQWWLLLGALFISFALLWYIIDRRRMLPIFLVGFIVFGISVMADGIGSTLLLWDYPHMTVPWGSRLMSANLIIPVGYMLIYQWFRGWRLFFVASIALSALYSFVFEPFAVALNVYVLLNWKYLFSFPIFIGIGLFAKWAVDALEKIQLEEGSTD